MGIASTRWLLATVAGGVLFGAMALALSASGSNGPDLPRSLELTEPAIAESGVSEVTASTQQTSAPPGTPGGPADDDTAIAAVDDPDTPGRNDGSPATVRGSDSGSDDDRIGSEQTTPIPFPVVTSPPSPPSSGDDDVRGGGPRPTVTPPPPAPTPTPGPIVVPGGIPGRGPAAEGIGSPGETPTPLPPAGDEDDDGSPGNSGGHRQDDRHDDDAEHGQSEDHRHDDH